MITLGIDSGTQSTKCVALDAESGAILASASRPHAMIGGLPPGHLEQHPADWVEASGGAIGECVAKLGERRGEVGGIGVSGQQHGLVPLDASGAVVRPAKLWCDTSTSAECEAFEAAFGGKEGLIARAGNAVLPGYTAPKILWLKRNEPANFAAARSFLLPHDYLNFWLTGAQTMEFGDASGTALLDVRRRVWDEELCAFVDPSLRERLPEVGPSDRPAGRLKAELAREWGLAEGVVVSAGGGDNMMGAIGTGNVRAGVVTASFGTSGTLYAYAEQPVIDPSGEVAAFCDSTGAWLPLVCTMNVTVATEQVRALFGWGVAQFDMAVESAPAGAGGILFLPYLNGERTPNLPNGTGVYHGLTAGNFNPENFARATMEGATLGLAYGLGRFRELGIAPSEIRLTGGGSKSAVWRQLAADVFGTPTVCLRSSEGAALGAAVQALWAREQAGGGSAGIAALTGRLVEVDAETRCEPDAGRAALYRERLELQARLTRDLRQGGHL
jgi:xylulokinase